MTIPENGLTLADYRALVQRETCRWCGATLPEEIDYYSHSGGWPVKGWEGLWWLSIECPKCGYEWSLWKLGVERPE